MTSAAASTQVQYHVRGPTTSREARVRLKADTTYVVTVMRLDAAAAISIVVALGRAGAIEAVLMINTGRVRGGSDH
jgi:hypothetical protein